MKKNIATPKSNKWRYNVQNFYIYNISIPILNISNASTESSKSFILNHIGVVERINASKTHKYIWVLGEFYYW